MPERVRAATLAAFLGVLAIVSLYSSDPVSPAVATGALGLLVVVAAWQPVVALSLIAASLPLYHLPFDTGNAELAPSELLLVAMMLGTVVRATRHSLGTQRSTIEIGMRRVLHPFGRVAISALMVLAIIGLLLLSQVDNPDARAAGLRELRWTIVEPGIFVFMLLWHVTRPGERALIAGAYIAGGIMVAIWGLIDAATGNGVSAGGVLRVDGPFPHPNAFALYLLRLVAFLIALALVRRSRSPLLWMLGGLGGAALIASFSRSAALGLMVAGLILWPSLSRRVKVIATSAAAAVAIALLIIAGDRTAGPSGTDSLALRGDIWRSGLEMIRDRPITGYGPDQFLYVYSPRYIDPSAWAERFTSHGHNFLIDAWVRVGIIGAVFALLALLAIVRMAREATGALKEPAFDALSIAAVVALAAAGMQGLVDNGYFVHDLAMSAWLLAWFALARSGYQQLRGARLHERYSDRRSRARRFAPL